PGATARMTARRPGASMPGRSVPVPSGTIDSAGAYCAGWSVTVVRPATTLTGPDMAGTANSLVARLTSAADTLGSVTVMTALTTCRPGHPDATTSAVSGTSTADPGADTTAVALPPLNVIEPSLTGESTARATSFTAAVSLARSTLIFRGWSSPPVRCAHICA